MRVLVTGAGGFVGGVVAAYLHNAGVSVVGTVHSRDIDVPFMTVKFELSEPWPDLGGFDTIIHAAGSLPHKEKNFQIYKRNNIDAMQELLVYAKSHNIPRIIYLSTIGIYGEFRDETITEESDRINQDSYGLTKYIAECLLRASGIKNISLRMPGIIGKGSHGVWLPNTVEKFLKNENVVIYSPDFETRNFVWVEDLARFTAHLLRMEQWKYNIVNLAAHEKITVRKIVDEIKKLTGSHSNIIIDNSIRRPFCMDDARAVEMGYVSITPVEMVHKFCSSEEVNFDF